MLNNKPMTRDEKRKRDNFLRREKLKKIKEEGGEAYEYRLKQQRESREKLKENKEKYESRLEKQREYGKNYRSKIKRDPAKYLQLKARWAEKQRKRMAIARANLKDVYLNKLLIQQRFRQGQITNELTQLKKLNVQTIRLVRNNESQKVLGRYITKNFNLKKGGKNYEKTSRIVEHTTG